MTKNVGSVDRTIRLVLGVVLLSLYFFLPGDQRFFALIGIVPLATALMNWCPLYTLFGIRTCAAEGPK